VWIFIDNTQVWLKPRKISGTLEWRPKNVLLLPAALSLKEGPLFEWKLSGCLDRRGGIKIRWTRPNVTCSVVHGLWWADEKYFTHECVSNGHNTHVCDPHAKDSAGMVGKIRPGPYLLPTRLSAQSCRNAEETVLLVSSNMCL
jgi:hypothetical protein